MMMIHTGCTEYHNRLSAHPAPMSIITGTITANFTAELSLSNSCAIRDPWLELVQVQLTTISNSEFNGGLVLKCI